MSLRPLFWMVVGAGATLVAGAWGERESLPVPGDLQQTFSAKNAVLMEASVKTNTDYAAENILSRTPWLKPKADPFGESPAVVRRKVATVVEKHEPPPLVFPFEYVGKLTTDGKETLFLSKGEQIYPVAEGETLENLYRVEHTSSDSIELSYLPDARKMTITLDSITAKHAAGAATAPLNGMSESIALPAVYSGGTVDPQPTMNQPPVEQKEMMADLHPTLAPTAVYSPAGDLIQGNETPVPPVPMPPERMHPGMVPPGMVPPGAPQ